MKRPRWLSALLAGPPSAATSTLATGRPLDVTPVQLNEMLSRGGEAPVVIDVREPSEFGQGHVPGAELIPLGQLAGSLEKLDPARPLVVICAHGNRSRPAAALLARHGFVVYNVVGGTTAWRQAGFPLV